MDNKSIIKFILAIAFLAVSAAGLFVFFSKDKAVPEAEEIQKAGRKENAESPDNTLQTKEIPDTGSPVNEDPNNPAAENAEDQKEDQEDAAQEEGPAEPEDLERFVVALSEETSGQTAKNLLDRGFIKDEAEFLEKLSGRKINAIAPGGYKISKKMDADQIADTLSASPYMKWAVIPEGLRKEEIADFLAQVLKWDAAKREQWIAAYSLDKPEYNEGVYFPDTYLIPVDEDPAAVAKRFIDKFNEKFAPYLVRFNEQNIKWTTGLTLASIVQREAANDADMPLIARILWNRLEREIPMSCDATLQYVRGDEGNGWWAPITLADKKIKSPYNTYLNKGLPPFPICNPGLAAIEAVLDPAESDCLYYLHDADRITRCAETYAEHESNIKAYLQ
ncbi:MAG TPA: endolytic transglycosylase MltG [Candidatus Paceibacterota bacterium]|nr:endolytic transglycosylase MltG [Candidatus Pacearchaeota archaeon]HRZ51123.1 endolytic transglycosylase MltG [Candidatus Paceibacterota bacterium]HSA36870.1 endolytic transglycosylase MltG [Candidatus Paceibacterota bacterium]